MEADKANTSKQNTETNETPQNTVNSAEADSSIEYWQIMKTIADQDLQLKKFQYENEVERMGYARELHRQNLLLVDLKIKEQNLKIQTLQAQNNLD